MQLPSVHINLKKTPGSQPGSWMQTLLCVFSGGTRVIMPTAKATHSTRTKAVFLVRFCHLLEGQQTYLHDSWEWRSEIPCLKTGITWPCTMFPANCASRHVIPCCELCMKTQRKLSLLNQDYLKLITVLFWFLALSWLCVIFVFTWEFIILFYHICLNSL